MTYIFFHNIELTKLYFNDSLTKIPFRFSLTSSNAPSISPYPSVESPSAIHTHYPIVTTSSGPSYTPNLNPSSHQSIDPTEPSHNPSIRPSLIESIEPSRDTWPSPIPLRTPSQIPTSLKSGQPSLRPSNWPTVFRSLFSSRSPSALPHFYESSTCGISNQTRSDRIYKILENVTDIDLLYNETSPQGKAANWIIHDDEHFMCPNAIYDCPNALVQRWVSAENVANIFPLLR